jgi:hypothetical protein
METGLKLHKRVTLVMLGKGDEIDGGVALIRSG